MNISKCVVYMIVLLSILVSGLSYPSSGKFTIEHVELDIDTFAIEIDESPNNSGHMNSVDRNKSIRIYHKISNPSKSIFGDIKIKCIHPEAYHFLNDTNCNCDIEYNYKDLKTNKTYITIKIDKLNKCECMYISYVVNILKNVDQGKYPLPELKSIKQYECRSGSDKLSGMSDENPDNDYIYINNCNPVIEYLSFLPDSEFEVPGSLKDNGSDYTLFKDGKVDVNIKTYDEDYDGNLSCVRYEIRTLDNGTNVTNGPFNLNCSTSSIILDKYGKYYFLVKLSDTYNEVEEQYNKTFSILEITMSEYYKEQYKNTAYISFGICIVFVLSTIFLAILGSKLRYVSPFITILASLIIFILVPNYQYNIVLGQMFVFTLIGHTSIELFAKKYYKNNLLNRLLALWAMVYLSIFFIIYVMLFDILHTITKAIPIIGNVNGQVLDIIPIMMIFTFILVVKPFIPEKDSYDYYIFILLIFSVLIYVLFVLLGIGQSNVDQITQFGILEIIRILLSESVTLISITLIFLSTGINCRTDYKQDK